MQTRGRKRAASSEPDSPPATKASKASKPGESEQAKNWGKNKVHKQYRQADKRKPPRQADADDDAQPTADDDLLPTADEDVLPTTNEDVQMSSDVGENEELGGSRLFQASVEDEIDDVGVKDAYEKEEDLDSSGVFDPLIEGVVRDADHLDLVDWEEIAAALEESEREEEAQVNEDVPPDGKVTYKANAKAGLEDRIKRREKKLRFVKETLGLTPGVPPHLKKPRVNKFSPDAFLSMTNGPNVPIPKLEDMDEADKHTRLKFRLRVAETLRRRTNQSKDDTHTNGFSHHSRNRVKKKKPEEESDRVLGLMHPITASILGKDVITRQDFLNMPGLTAEDLRGWIIYLIVVELESGEMRAYVGVSVRADGSGIRIIGEYDAAFWWASQGYYRGGVSDGLAEFAMRDDVQTIHIRPLMSVPIPDVFYTDKEHPEVDDLQQFLADCEGVFVDICRSLAELSGSYHHGYFGVIDHDEQTALYREARPNLQYPWKVGLNQMSPYRQGKGSQEVGVVERVMTKRVREKCSAQNGVCPIDQNDITKSRNANPFKGRLQYLPEEYVCNGCHHWSKKQFKKALACATLGEFRSFRSMFKHVDKSKLDYTECPLCLETLDKIKTNPIKHLEGFEQEAVCVQCRGFLHRGMREPERAKEIMALKNWDGLRIWKASFEELPGKATELKDFEINLDDDCPTCHKEFDERPMIDGVRQVYKEARKHLHNLPCEPESLGLRGLKDVQAICMECYYWAHGWVFGASANKRKKAHHARRKALKDCNTLEEIEEIREQFPTIRKAEINPSRTSMEVLQLLATIVARRTHSSV